MLYSKSISLKLTLNFILSLFFSIALRIATAHDFRVIRVRTWARARTNVRDFPQIKLNSEIIYPFHFPS